MDRGPVGVNLSNGKSNGSNVFEETAPTLDQASGRLAVAYSVQPESSTKSAPNSLVARKTDSAEAITASQQKRSDRGTIIGEGRALDSGGDGFDAPDDPKPDGPRYAAMGDAVTVNCAEWLGLRLLAALRREGSYNGPIGMEEVARAQNA